LRLELKKRTISPKNNETKKFTNIIIKLVIENNKIIWSCSNRLSNIIFNNLNTFSVISDPQVGGGFP
jgi:hypothetical protein